MELSLFDLHCDTAYEAYLTHQTLKNNSLAVSFDKALRYQKYLQTFAIWSSSSLNNNDAFEQFKNICKYLNDELYSSAAKDSNRHIIAVEDARLLDGDISRLDLLYALNVKILTLTWSGYSCIGGAHNTSFGLTEFGTEVVKRCFELGIVVDISHASREASRNVFDLSNKKYPIIASHSNSNKITRHSRNLNDDEFINIVISKGLVGINLYYKHLGILPNDSENKIIDKIMEHIEHYLSLGGENTVCFGCDFDGAITPKTLNNISDLYKIADRMLSKGYSDELIHKIFWDNAYNFANKNFYKQNTGR